jgi:DNA-binding NtrC family response regulator
MSAMEHKPEFSLAEKTSVKSVKILIVEDDLCLKSAVLRILDSLDGHVETQWVTTAQEAMDSLQQTQYDFVISDYLLPDCENGLWVWEKCRKQFPNMPFLLMSGIPVEAFLEITMGRKICPSFLPKPFWPGELRETISYMLTEALERKRA